MSEASAPGAFAAASAVKRVGDGRYEGTVAEGWDIAGNANGGYLLAIAARAVTDATGHPDPVTITAHYLAPGKPGRVDLDVDVVRGGGRHATATFAVRSTERALIVGVATTTDLAAASGPLRVDATPPDLPPPEDCPLTEPGDPLPPPFTGRVEIRLHPDDVPFRAGAPGGDARMRGWFRLRGGELVDTLALVLAVDSFPPTSFNANLPIGWTPTIELTAHVRHHPAPGWLACAFVTRNVAGGYLETDGEIWDVSGALVAQSRQLQLVPATRA
ncbi:MAG: thioesterase family protein [Acidimicrobiia bacterium]|jgi:acyl-CoA thioesterase